MKVDRLKKSDIAITALFELGGANSWVRTEDIAVSAWNIAPQSFSMDGYEQYPSVDKVRYTLGDAKKPPEELVDGDSRRGWRLTPNGVARYKTLEPASVANHVPLSVANQFSRLRKSAAFQQWKTGAESVHPYVLAETVEVPADSQPSVVAYRVDFLLNDAIEAVDKEIEDFLRWFKLNLQ